MGISSDDLLYEIFFRLPLVSLLRFKCVSKSWYSLILKIGSFLHHMNDSNDNDEIAVLLLSSHNNPIDNINPTHSVFTIFRLNIFLHMTMIKNREEQHLDLVLNNSCNGLLLYHQSFRHSKKHTQPQFHDKYNVSSDESRVFYVCNPITKHYFKLPNIELKDLADQDEYKKHMLNTRKACIVFDPSVSHSYKVIRCCLKREEACYNHYNLYVYSSETRSWKLLTRFTGSFKAGFRTALFNGVFYWYAEVGDVCVCFDIKNENVWFPSLPTSPFIRRTCLYFEENGGKLCLIENIHYSFHTSSTHVLTLPCNFDIMEMEQQEDGRHCVWQVKCHVNINGGYDHILRKLPKLQRRMPFDVCIMNMYKMTTTKGKNEEEAVLLMNIVGTNKLITYNITSNTFGQEFIIIPNIKHRPVLRGIVPYTPTLASAS